MMVSQGICLKHEAKASTVPSLGRPFLMVKGQGCRTSLSSLTGKTSSFFLSKTRRSEAAAIVFSDTPPPPASCLLRPISTRPALIAVRSSLAVRSPLAVRQGAAVVCRSSASETPAASTPEPVPAAAIAASKVPAPRHTPLSLEPPCEGKTYEGTLLLQCPDRQGVIAAVSQLLYGFGCNIITSDQCKDFDFNIFFQRIAFDYSELVVGPGNVILLERAVAELAQRFNMTWRISYKGRLKRLAVLVSKQPHCLYDILIRHRSGELQCEIPVVISNHPDLAPIAESFNIPFKHIPILKEGAVSLSPVADSAVTHLKDTQASAENADQSTPASYGTAAVSLSSVEDSDTGNSGLPRSASPSFKPAGTVHSAHSVHLPSASGPTAAAKLRQEAEIERLLAELRIDTIVLARYMQVLSAEFCTRHWAHTINIHHSFLPAFEGARPYHRAHARGVKIIGATAHYATPELDAGPIIDQGVARISHRDAVEDMVRKGRDLERMVLANALRWHLDDRILVHNNRTIVFAD